MNETMLRRIATIKTHEVENLPRIHIDSEEVMFHLMVWRNRNKDKVRNLNPIITEGTISALSEDNYFYFLQSDDNIYMMKKILDGEDECVAFIFNKETSTIKEVVNTISFYPEDEAIQDLLTTYATCMAYLNHIGITELGNGEVFTINEVEI